MTFVCHVTSQDRKIKGSCDFIVWNHLSQITILLSLVAIGTVEMNIYILILVWYVILQDHVIKGPCDFMARSP